MLRTLLLTLLLITCSSVYAVDPVYIETKSGTINLIPVQEDSATNLFSITLGKKVKGKFFLFHQVQAGGKNVINGNAEFKNLSETSVFVVYYVALRDTHGHLIAATSGDLEVGLDNNIHQFASAFMPVPLKRFAEITNYEIIMYESTKSIGTE